MNRGDKFCFKCGSKVSEISPSARVSTPEDQGASSSSSTKSLSQYLACKAEERRAYNKPNNKTGFKRKFNDPGSSSKRVANNRVVINVGLITENEEGNLAIVRGSRVALKVGKDYGVVEVCQAAVKKHADHDQFFLWRGRLHLALS